MGNLKGLPVGKPFAYSSFGIFNVKVLPCLGALCRLISPRCILAI